MIIQLVDLNPDMVDAWTTEFHDCEDVMIYLDDFFKPETDCIVSPANSFGFMDGGLDGVITKRLGKQIQYNIQKRISETPIGELLVGQAILVQTENDKIPFCVSAPTMRTPATNIKDTVNVYLASKAIFSLLKPMSDSPQDVINKVTISGLGTGVGGVAPEICARQMRQAYDDVWLGKYEAPTNSMVAKLNHESLKYGN